MRAAHHASITHITGTIRSAASGRAERRGDLPLPGDEPSIPLAALARDTVRRWCNALPATHYLVTVRDSSDARSTHAHLTAAELLQSLGWLRHRNACGAHVEARPWAPRHILVDGLTPACLERLAGQHEPAVVVEAGLGLLQAWVTIAEDDIAPEVAASVARHLATRYGGLIPAVSARATGRLPCFTHPSAQRDTSGRPRFLRLVSAKAGVHRNAADLVAAARAELARERNGCRAGPRPRRDVRERG